MSSEPDRPKFAWGEDKKLNAVQQAARRSAQLEANGAAISALQSRVDGLSGPQPLVIAPSQGGTTHWDYPDHDPDYLAGRITYAEAHRRAEARRDERRRAARTGLPDPGGSGAPRCPLCHGSGHGNVFPEGMGWAPCEKCDAEEFFELSRKSLDAAQPGMSGYVPDLRLLDKLDAAREKVRACRECMQVAEDPMAGSFVGTGKAALKLPQQLPRCAMCNGSGRDPDVAWRDSGVQQDTGASVPPPEKPWQAASRQEEPPWLTARRQASSVGGISVY